MTNRKYTDLAIKDINEFIYGTSPNPVICKNELTIGGGQIFPEINFTLPPMKITKDTMPEVSKQYKEIIEGVCKRAKELYIPGLVVEIETLPPMTFNPTWAVEITKIAKDIMNEYEQKYGLKSVLRITPTDIREGKELTHMWHGKHWDNIIETFEGCAKAGADLLSIESVGGKEIHDDAVIYCDIEKALFALGVIAIKDMSILWKAICDIAADANCIAAGDTACGFGNTAMVLAEREYVPRVFSAVIRVMTVIRSLVAFEQGAQGPDKDCGYEGVYIKAITGCPISMEGKTSACAHLSPVGNIAASVADLWSNESVQNIKLLGGMAPTVYLEQLAYDCRLMNTASLKGYDKALMMRDLLTDSDSQLDPQAYILRPDVVLKIADEIIKENTHFNRTRKAAILTIEELRKAIQEQKLSIIDKELTWLDTIESQLENVPENEEEFTAKMLKECESDKFDPQKYDMK